MPTQQATRGSQQSAGKAKPGASPKPQAKKPVPAQAAAGSTGTSDSVYGVVSVLYHALQGAETYVQYIDDAREAGDEELVTFFEECHEEETSRAARAKALLASRIGAADDEDDEDEDEDEDDEDDEEEEEDEE